MMTTDYHIPVMLNECIDALNISPDGFYVDATYGGGGHSAAILNNLTSGKLYAFDQDEDVHDRVPDDERLVFIDHNFQYIKNFLKFYDAIPVDGILADLGVSSHQFDTAERGFSFRFDADLDMRMNQDQDLTAKDVVNSYSEQELTNILKQYGEFRRAYPLARKIVQRRQSATINTTSELKEIATPFLERNHHSKGLAQIFQAIRIEVNAEMKALEEFLLGAVDVLKSGGRLVVMTYHSLEDRLVKNLMLKGSLTGDVEKDLYGNVIKPLDAVQRKPILASDEEMEVNPRARSAKLRIAQKI